MHGGERDGQGGRLVKVHVGGRAEQPAMVGQRVFGEGSTTGAHDLVADFDAFGVGPEFGDFAGPFHPEHGADAAGGAMGVALGHAEVGPVEAAGMHLDQHLGAFRRRFCDIGDFSAVGAVDIGFHGLTHGWLERKGFEVSRKAGATYLAPLAGRGRIASQMRSG